MRNLASEYDVWKLHSGAAIALLAIFTIVGAYGTLLINVAVVDLWIASVSLIQGCMMFASSYVEEEHQFWYWMTSGWFAWLFFKRQVNLTSR